MGKIERFIICEHVDRSNPKKEVIKAWTHDGYLESNPEITVTAVSEPLFSGARELLAKGWDPDTLLTTRRPKRNFDNFVPQTIKYLASKDVDGLSIVDYEQKKNDPGHCGEPEVSLDGDCGRALAKHPTSINTTII